MIIRLLYFLCLLNYFLFGYSCDLSYTTTIYSSDNCCNAVVNGIFTIPDGITTIGSNAFENCINLQNINFPSSLSTIGSSAFKSTGLTSLTLTPNINSIGKSVFSKCYYLTSVSFSIGLISIPSDMFSYTGIKSITIPVEIIGIESSAFQYSALETIIISNPYLTFGSYALANTNINSITLPSNLNTLPSYLFDGCYKLTSISLPSSLTTIERNVFSGTSISSLVIPSTVSTIKSYAFVNMTNLLTIDIQSTINNIEEYTFYGCSALSSFTIPSSVSTISTSSFEKSGIESISLPISLTTIKNSAFKNTKLTSLYIPSTIVSIESEAFAMTISSTLKGDYISYQNRDSLMINDDVFTGVKYVDGSDYIFSKISSRVSVCSLTNKDTIESSDNCCSIITDNTFTVPNSITTIGTDAFKNCQNIKTITLSNNLATIGEYAFYNSSLTSFTFIPSIIYLGKNAFMHSKVSSITLSTGLISIRTDTFAYTLIKSITIPNTITSIGSGAFQYSSLKLITFQNPNVYIQSMAFAYTQLITLTFPSDTTSIENDICKNCNILTNVVLPSGLTNIGSGSFENCIKLNTITLPPTLTTIQNSAFKNTGLTSLYIPSGITTIESEAFAMTVSNTLKGDHISYQNISSLVINDDVFTGVKYSNGSEYIFSKVKSSANQIIINIPLIPNIPNTTLIKQILDTYIDYINNLKSKTIIGSDIVFNIKSNPTFDLDYDKYILNESMRTIFLSNMTKELNDIIGLNINIDVLKRGSIIVEYSIININNLTFNQTLSKLLEIYQVSQKSYLLSYINKIYLPTISLVCNNQIVSDLSNCSIIKPQIHMTVRAVVSDISLIIISLVLIFLFGVCLCLTIIICFYKNYMKNKKAVSVETDTILIELA